VEAEAARFLQTPVTPAEAGVQFVGLSAGWMSEVRSFRKGCEL